MENNIKEVIFEPQDDFPKPDVEIPEQVPEEHKEIMREFLLSGYFFDKGLNINRFLDADKTVDIEKLELAILLAVEYLEFSVKHKNPIYVFLRSMDLYFKARGISIDNIERITEESQFILGFSQAVADENKLTREIIIQYEPTKRDSGKD